MRSTTRTHRGRSRSCRSSRSSRRIWTPSSSAPGRLPRPMPRPADELRELVESYLAGLEFLPALASLDESMRYSFAGGGKRVRPVLCLAAGEAAGGDLDRVLPAAAAGGALASVSLLAHGPP